MQRARRFPIALLLSLAAAAHPLAQTAPTIQFTDAKLANGLRVIVSEDHTAPVYSIAVHYNVGSRDERPGRTGFAHLFEHMMFKGSENVGPGEHFMFGMTVLNKVIGGGPTGRLFRHLREEKGYTYGAGSSVDAPRFRGTWTADTDVRTEVTEAALTDLLDEIKQVRETPIPAKEFADAKRSLVASFALTLESPQALLNNAVTRYRFGLPADYWDRYPQRIMAITEADAQAMAKKYLDPARLQIVAVGNSEGVARALRKLGPVEVYDADGKRITTY